MNRYSIQIAFIVFSLVISSCREIKERVGDSIMLPEVMTLVEEGKLGKEMELFCGEKILIYIDSMHCGACQITRLRNLQEQIKSIEKPVFIVLDAPQVEIRSLLNIIYSSKIEIPVFFDLDHDIALNNRRSLDKRSNIHVWLLDDNNVILENGEENVLMKDRF